MGEMKMKKYESVTNEVSTATEDQQFMQLKVKAD